MTLAKFVDRFAFAISVVSGVVAAFAGGYGWTRTAVASGCLAAIAPIVNRWASGRLTFAPRALSKRQSEILKKALREGPRFSIWLNHNRMEGEPAAFHAQLHQALNDAGLDVKWFGGLNNATTGIEISGPEILEKARLMKAFKAAKIKFTNVVYTDAPATEHSPLNSVGVCVSIGSRF